VISDITPDAVKIGMLPTAKSVEIVAEFITKHNINNVVLDTICISTSGHSLTLSDVPSAIAEKLFPVATIITPNIPEAETIAEHKISSVDDMISTAKDFLESYSPKAVLIKGGHMTNTDTLTDILATESGIKPITNHYINTPNTHGTGCSLSSAIASYLAMGQDIDEAVTNACQWLHCAILHGKDYQLGHGHGPINHIFK
jgi:hydroxymethylpyrimidine/phosphomethylpyrimidine kinase